MSRGTTNSTRFDSDRINVGVAEYQATDSGTDLNTSGLGSCLAVALYDPKSGVAGLGHYMLPSRPEGSSDEDGKFVDTGIEALIADMRRLGADPDNLVAKIAGGGTLLSKTGNGEPIGPQNVEAARRILDEMDVSLVAEDIGDDYGRSIRFDTDTGSLTVVGAHTETIEL